MIRIPSLERPDFAALGLAALNLTLVTAMLIVVFWAVRVEASGVAPAAVPPAISPTIPSSFSAPHLPLFGRSYIAPTPQPPKLAPSAVNAAPAPSPYELQPLQWRVTGIIIAEDGAPIALIERQGQATETRRVTVGAEVGEWRVEQIVPRSVSFRRGTASIVVALDPTP